MKKSDIIYIVVSILTAIAFITMSNTYADVGDDAVAVAGDSVKKPADIDSLIHHYSKVHNSRHTDSMVLELTVECGAWYPDIIMAQYVRESGRGTSRLARTHHNLFGMGKATQRKTCRQKPGLEGKWASYHNWQLSVIDRVLWERAMWEHKPARDQYISKICRIYAEDPNYRLLILNAAEEWAYCIDIH